MGTAHLREEDVRRIVGEGVREVVREEQVPTRITLGEIAHGVYALNPRQASFETREAMREYLEVREARLPPLRPNERRIAGGVVTNAMIDAEVSRGR
jgi:hypothetical protein